MVCHGVQGDSKYKLYYDKTQMGGHTPIRYNIKMVKRSYPRTHPRTGIGLEKFNRHFQGFFDAEETRYISRRPGRNTYFGKGASRRSPGSIQS